MKYIIFLRMVAVFLVLSFIYLSNGKLDSENGDSLAFRYLPYSILNEFDFDLDEFRQDLLEYHPWLTYTDASGEKLPYYLIKAGGHYLSTFGIGPALLALPILFVPIKFFHYPPDSPLIIFLTKFTASISIALSAIFIFLSVRFLVGGKKAGLATFIYALCSGMWSLTSQVLTQQTAGELFLALSIYFLIKGMREPKLVSYSGFALGLATIMRPTNVIVFIIVGIYILHKYKARFVAYLFYALGPFLFIAWYNYFYHGSVFLFSQMIYNPFGAFYKTSSANMWSTPLFIGLAGIFFSPSRGLFIYSPVFIFSFLGMSLAWKKNENPIFKYFSVIVIALVILHAKWYDWWGGWTFGCRVLNDTVPFLILLLLPTLNYARQQKKVIPVFIFTLILSFLIQLMGAYLYNDSWNRNPNIDLNQQRLWSWKNGQLAHYIKIFFDKRGQKI
jgi:hypothetical protein